MRRSTNLQLQGSLLGALLMFCPQSPESLLKSQIAICKGKKIRILSRVRRAFAHLVGGFDSNFETCVTCLINEARFPMEFGLHYLPFIFR